MGLFGKSKKERETEYMSRLDVPSCLKEDFELIIDDIFTIMGVGTVATGNILTGMCREGENACIYKANGDILETRITTVDVHTKERKANGLYRDFKDLVERLSSKEINKRTVENLIKSGALDCFGVTRKQQMIVYASVIDSIQKERKNEIAGQMSLMDLLGEEDQQSFKITYPDVGEYEKEQKLAMEKEVLGIYVSGHPLEDDMERLEEGRRLIQIAITKLLQGRIMESYHEKEADSNRLKLLKELEEEQMKKKEKEVKKIPRDRTREIVGERLAKIEEGERDFRF